MSGALLLKHTRKKGCFIPCYFTPLVRLSSLGEISHYLPGMVLVRLLRKSEPMSQYGVMVRSPITAIFTLHQLISDEYDPRNPIPPQAAAVPEFKIV
jgi:hypothetical protein